MKRLELSAIPIAVTSLALSCPGIIGDRSREADPGPARPAGSAVAPPVAASQ